EPRRSGAMSKPGFRIYWVGAGGKRAGTLMRKVEHLFDDPAPSAVSDNDDDVPASLARQVAALRADDEGLARYLWTEDFEVRKVDVDIHPQTAAGGAYAIGASEIPLRVAYAASQTPGGNWRVLVPRFGWSLVLETLEVAPETLRAMIFAAMLGEKA